MEKFGVYKRDLLKKSVIAARDDQKAASEQFKDAMTRLKEAYHFEGGDLEKTYNAIKADYDRCSSRAEAVRKRIRDMNTIAEDLFSEWDKEIAQISTESLRDSSRQKLRTTRQRYDELHRALKQAESSMEPVLVKFHDQILYLKHNLNAEAIASLKGESADIQKEIGKLLQEMNAAITKADQFISAQS
jgi:uncharacterized protein YukE